MTKTTPEVRLIEQATALKTIASILHKSALVCNELNPTTREKGICAFSDMLNSTLAEAGHIKTIINITSRQLKEKHSFSETQILEITDSRATTQCLYDQMIDFVHLIDSTLEGSANNPRVFAGYYAKRMMAFSRHIDDQGDALHRSLKS